MPEIFRQYQKFNFSVFFANILYIFYAIVFENEELKMELTVTKKLLSPILDRLVNVSSNERATFERLGYLSIKAEENQLLLSTGNGFIKALHTIPCDDSLCIIKQGQAVINVRTMSNIINAAADDERIEIKATENKSDGKHYLSRNIIGQKRNIRIPLIPEPADVELKKVSGKNVFEINSSLFFNGVKQVAPWAGVEEYKAKYKQVYIEFRKNETRFVCGDGGKFAVVINKDDTNNSKFTEETDYKGYIIPAEQARILSSLFEDMPTVSITFGQTNYLFKSDGLKVVLDGIPQDYVDYLPYTIQLDRFDKREVSAQITGTALKALVADMEAIRDSDYEKRKGCIPVKFSLSEGGLKCTTDFLNVYDGSFEVDKYERHSGEYEIEDKFAMMLFSNVLKFGNSNCYEFSFMHKGDLVFCRFMDDDENSQRIVFFAPIVETN